ncbi:MAG: hypothetical protein NUW02_02045 [Candidatus Campbellbacteria bacterium]|nr:hypothetical protein [Candidatus Campbellbacteria bacterium]
MATSSTFFILVNGLQDYSAAIQAVSTVILALITLGYAFSTKRMASLMEKQMSPSIFIENIMAGSPFIEDWFRERPDEQLESTFFELKVILDVRNEGNGSGSIYKPTLTLSSTAHDFPFSTKLRPITISHETYNRRTQGSMETSETRSIDHGSSVFLSGGDSRRLELEYRFMIETKDECDFIKRVKKNPEIVTYSLVTHDNLNKGYKILVTDVKGVRECSLI